MCLEKNLVIDHKEEILCTFTKQWEVDSSYGLLTVKLPTRLIKRGGVYFLKTFGKYEKVHIQFVDEVLAKYYVRLHNPEKYLALFC